MAEEVHGENHPIPAIARYYPKIYDITLCRVQTDEGLEGWGEFIDKKSVGQEQADALVGQDPLDLDPYDRSDAFTCALLDKVDMDVVERYRVA